MAGFKPPKNLYLLKFEHPSYEGLKITATSVSMETMLWVQSLGSRVAEVANNPDGFRKIVDVLIGAILSWNLEDDDDRPIEVSAAALLAQSPVFVADIMVAWTAAITGVSGPLGEGSISGPQFPEGSIPMETLSSSLLN